MPLAQLRASPPEVPGRLGAEPERSYIGMASYTHMSMGHDSSRESAASIDSACTIE